MHIRRLIAGVALLVALARLAANAQTLPPVEPQLRQTAEEVAAKVIAGTPLRLRYGVLFIRAGQLEQVYLTCQTPDLEQVDAVRAAALQLANDAGLAGDGQTASQARDTYDALTHPVVPAGCSPRSIARS